MTPEVHPTIVRIKTRARFLRKGKPGLAQHDALNEAARLLGYANYHAAINAVERERKTP